MSLRILGFQHEQEIKQARVQIRTMSIPAASCPPPSWNTPTSQGRSNQHIFSHRVVPSRRLTPPHLARVLKKSPCTPFLGGGGYPKPPGGWTPPRTISSPPQPRRRLLGDALRRGPSAGRARPPPPRPGAPHGCPQPALVPSCPSAGRRSAPPGSSSAACWGRGSSYPRGDPTRQPAPRVVPPAPGRAGGGLHPGKKPPGGGGCRR